MTTTSKLFNAPMVRALIAGTKTQTRRLIKPQGKFVWMELSPSRDEVYFTDVPHTYGPSTMLTLNRPGDIFYVREAWRVSKKYDDYSPVTNKRGGPVLPPRGMTVLFEAGGSIATQASGLWAPDNSYPGAGERNAWAGKLRQGMHLPRWGSRLTLVVTETRVQRLQQISEAEAEAEGVEVLSESWAGKAFKDYGRPGGGF